ncbi:MAG: tyrosine-type recombinase/integrase [Prevotella sp.]|nr:tyrosine-type recombinase/integrase [Prevotella sp.]
MNKNNPISAFRRYLRLQRGLSANTLEAYLHDVGKLVEWNSPLPTSPCRGGEEINDCTKKDAQAGTPPLQGEVGRGLLGLSLADLQEFSASLHDLGISLSSHARILCGVRAFYKFLAMDGWIEQDPAELLESPVQDKHLPEVLSTEEVDMLEASIDLSKWEGHRNRAIIEVLFSCGLRVSELVTLTLSQVYEEEGFLRVLGKGSKERLVPISQRAIKELHLWYDNRCHMKIKPGEEDYVFLNRRGAHLTRTMILIMIKQQAAMAGIKKTISPHTLRHSFATALLEGGASLRAIQAMLGHERIGTTEIYTHIDMSTLREEIEQHHPRNIMGRK